jgi:putative hydrolase
MSNAWIAERLRQAANLLAAQGANPFRVSAYRRAGDAIEALEADVRDMAEAGGHASLEAIPGVGRSIAGAVAEMLATGQWGFLERLKGAADPEALFCFVPGIGPSLAQKIQATLHLDSLEALEVAAHDGRLRQVPGFGARRAAMVHNALVQLLARARPPPVHLADEPEVGLLLDVDREYREKAASDALRKIAPKRFNPSGEAWLPIMHTVRGPWHFTALYSNTALAHQLGRTGDWVVIYFHRDAKPEGRRTIVTETQGSARGRRVVRGREAECEQWHVDSEPRRVARDDPGVTDRDWWSELVTPCGLTCPECHGVLGEVRDRRVLRFRCQTGHAYSAMTLLKALAATSEAAVGASLRALAQESELARRLAVQPGHAADAGALASLASSIMSDVLELRTMLRSRPQQVEFAPSPLSRAHESSGGDQHSPER